jgi:hypothetical protein
VNVKVYFIYPGDSDPYYVTDGRRKPVASVDAPVIDANTERGMFRWATFQMPAPKDYSTWRPTLPDGWKPKWFVEVRAGGTLIGSFFTVDDGTPDFRLDQ